MAARRPRQDSNRRPESEIRNSDAAAEWVGMPEFDPVGERVKLVLKFDGEEDRQRLFDRLGLHLAKATRGTWSSWWPPRPGEDLSSLRLDFEEEREVAADFGSWLRAEPGGVVDFAGWLAAEPGGR